MTTLTRRALVKAGLATPVALAMVPGLGMATAAAAPRGRSGRTKPTIVLVHGAWADGSGFQVAVEHLQHRGYTVIVPANPLRDLQGDAAYLASVLATIPGPIVLGGHSYGGMVTTNTATGNPNVKALVYIAAFAPDEGESAGSIEAINPGSQLGRDVLTARPYPGGVDLYITPSVFHEAFCADVPAEKAAFMAASQRPLAAAVFSQKSGSPAWKTIPSWYMVAAHDHAIPAATERFMAKRAGATTVEVRSSHVAMISHPEAVARLILEAAHAVA